MPHAPQFAASLCVSTQLPLQSVSNPQPAVVHVPVLQTAGDVQAFAHMPQLAGSFVRSTHAPAQLV